MEKFFLGSSFVSHKLKVVNHQDIYGTKLFLKGCGIFVTQGFYEFVNELLGRQINNIAIRIILFYVPDN